MTQLYRLDCSAADIAAAFDADPGKDPWAGGYIAPGGFAPVVIRSREGRYLAPRLWGVPPPPKVALVGGPPVTTLRNIDSPFWIGSMRHTQFRCLIPATSFMVWGAGSAQHRAPRHWFSLPAAPVFAIAGLWRDSEIVSFAMLTTEANDAVARVRDGAMPVILAPWDYERWLTGSLDDIRGLIEPFPAQQMIDSPNPPKPFAPQP